MARNTQKVDFFFEQGQETGVDDVLQEKSPATVRNLAWVDEGVARTRQPYKVNALPVSASWVGTTHVVSDGESAFYQTEIGKIVTADEAPITDVFFDDSPMVDVSKFSDDGSDMNSKTASVAVLGDYIAVVFDLTPSDGVGHFVFRVYERNTKELVGEHVDVGGAQPRITASGTRFTCVYEDIVLGNRLRFISFNTSGLTFSSSVNITTAYTGSFFETVADDTNTYVAFGNSTPRLTALKVTSSTGAVAATYTHATLDAATLGMAIKSGTLYVAFDDGTNLTAVSITTSSMAQANTITAKATTVFERISVCVYNDGAADRVCILAGDTNAVVPCVEVMDIDTALTTVLSGRVLERVQLMSKVFAAESGSTQQQPMAFFADTNASDSLQRHIVLCGVPQQTSAENYGWTGAVPSAVLTVDEAYVNNGTAHDDYPSYNISPSSTTGEFYFTCLRQTGFDTATGTVPSSLWGARTYVLDMSMRQPVPFERFGGQAYTAGGLMVHPVPGSYAEASVVGAPYVESDSKAAGALTGTYNYRAVWEMSNNRGVKIRSFPSPAYEVTLTAQQVALIISAPRFSVTNDTIGNYTYSLALYRTQAGGSIFNLTERIFLEGHVNGNAATGAVSVTDNNTDAVVGVGEVLRHGITGGDLGPIVTPAAEHVFTWRDRLCLVSAEDGRIWYSMPRVINRGPEFNPTLSFSIPNDPVAGAPINNQAVIFASNAIYVCSGSLADAAGRGQAIAVQQISHTVGCKDKRSVVVGSRGVYFQSKRGLELLTPDLKLERIRGLDDWLASGKTIQAADADPNTDEVAFLITAGSYSTPRVYRVNETNLNVSYDDWATTDATRVYSMTQHADQLRFTINNLTNTNFMFTNPDGTEGADLDSGGNRKEISVEYTSPWFQLDGPLGDQEVESLKLRFRMAAANGTPSRSTLTIGEAYDHAAVSVTNSYTVTPSGTIASPTIEEISLRPRRQRCSAFRFTVSYFGDGDDGETLLELIAARLEIGVVPGGAKVTPTATV